MKLINHTKTKFITSLGEFRVGKIMDFGKEEAKTLSRYPGIDSLDSLEDSKPSKSPYDLLKEEATALELKFAGNISTADLTTLIAEAKEGKE